MELSGHIRFLLLILFLVWSAGCGSRKGSNVAGSVVELTYWPAPNVQEIQLAESLVTVWNATHPSIHVRMQPIPVSQSTEEVLLAAIAGRTTPDVCSNIWPGALRDYTENGGLIPLDTFPDFDAVAKQRMPENLLKTFRSGDGHYYQFPWKTNPVMMFYNKRLFREAGVDSAPRTYADFLADAAKVTRDTNGDGVTDIWMGERDIRPIWWQRFYDVYAFYIAASGGKTFFTGDSVSFGDDNAVSVFRFFHECYSHGYFPRTFFQGGDPFLLEKKATHFSGPWEVATIQKFAPGMDFGVVPLPVPVVTGNPEYTTGDFKNIAIFSTTAHPREAWEFVKFLVTAEHDLLLLEICNQIPVRGDLQTNPLFANYFRQNPVMVEFARQAPYTRGVDGVADLKEIFDGISQEYEMCAVYGKKSPDQAVRDAVSRTKMIVEWNR